MATALTTPIARLRAAGCKVSTILGHDSEIGSFQYRVTLPKGVPGHYRTSAGRARLQSRPSEHRVLIWGSAYAPDLGRPVTKAEVSEMGNDVAELLGSLADHVETFDQSGSASRQHFIETGRFLTKTDTAETVTVEVGTSTLWAVDRVCSHLGARILRQVPTEGTCGYTTVTIQKEA